jgi:hypothetical protein
MDRSCRCFDFDFGVELYSSLTYDGTKRASLTYDGTKRASLGALFLLSAILLLCSCLDAKKKNFTLSITLIFGPMHEVVNVGKKITNYIV